MLGQLTEGLTKKAAGIMSVGSGDEVGFYVNLIRNNWWGPKYDLSKIPGPPGYWGLGKREAMREQDRSAKLCRCATQSPKKGFSLTCWPFKP
jgi:hypothetical protein